jgi:hypothetical protein
MGNPVPKTQRDLFLIPSGQNLLLNGSFESPAIP